MAEDFGAHFAETFSTSSATRAVISEEESEAPSVDAVKSMLTAVLDLRDKTALSAMTVERKVRDLCNAFDHLVEAESRERVVRELCLHAVDRKRVKKLATSYAEEEADLACIKMEEQLREALIPPYVWLFSKIAQLEGGVKFLVDLRAQLLDVIQAASANSPSSSPETLASLRTMDSHLRQLLAQWFGVGFLCLEQVTWESSCAMLQKVSDYEAVHPMRNWTDLKARVGAYRRCFVYTHRCMPGEPIVVLHVALTEDIPDTISSVVKHHRMVKRFSVDTHDNLTSAQSKSGEDTSLCKAAIFYSISSTQRGLQGIELGTYLIKQAVQTLKEELPHLVHFSTLSPIPGFRAWLLKTLQRKEPGIFSDSEMEHFSALMDCDSVSCNDRLLVLIKNNHWAEDNRLMSALETPLMRLCGRYLFHEKHRGRALDSVANFHLRNGAVLWRINWKGDLSARGLSNSCGIMVNYKYFLDQLEGNSTAYQEKHSVACGEQVLRLAEQAGKTIDKA